MRTIVNAMKKLLPIIIAVVLVGILVSVKRKRRSSDPEAPEGAWEPISGNPSQ